MLTPFVRKKLMIFAAEIISTIIDVLSDKSNPSIYSNLAKEKRFTIFLPLPQPKSSARFPSKFFEIFPSKILQ